MRYRKLGNTGLTVSEVGFGGGPISGDYMGPADEKEAIRALKRALELGVNFYDTVDRQGHGRSERLIGEAFKGDRDKIIIATKGGRLPGEREGKIVSDYSRGYIRQALEESLGRLRTDYVDIYQIHNPSLEVIEREEVFEVFDELRREGKIRFVGVCVGDPEEGVVAMHRGRVHSIQVTYNLLSQEAAGVLFPEAHRLGVGIIARVPLASGLLTGAFTKETTWPEGDMRRRYYPRERLERELKKIETLRFLVQSENQTLGQKALKFVLSNPHVSTVIPGVKTAREIEENVAASDGDYLSSEKLSRVRELWRSNFGL